MFYNSLNTDSLKRIANIVSNFKRHPMYLSYSRCSYCYVIHVGAHVIEVSKNGNTIPLVILSGLQW